MYGTVSCVLKKHRCHEILQRRDVYPLVKSLCGEFRILWNLLKNYVYFLPHSVAITKTRNGESGKGIGEWGMRNGKTRNTKRGNL